MIRKTLIQFIVGLTFCSMILSCSKEKKDLSGYISFKLDGISKNYTTYAGGGYYNSDHSTQISADETSSNYPSISLKFKGNKTGTYSSTNAVLFYYESSVLDGSYNNLDVGCTITISSYESAGGRIKGTFSGNVTSMGKGGTKVISAGSFDVYRLDDNK